jgi:hypothetical protein
MEVFGVQVIGICFQSHFNQIQWIPLGDFLHHPFQVRFGKQRGRTSSKIDCFDRTSLWQEIFFPFKLKADGIDHFFDQVFIGTEVKITIVACLLAKRDMDVDTGQFIYF